MFLVAGVNVVSPISFVEGSAGRAGLVAHYSSQTASAYGMQLHFLQQLPSVGVFLVLLSFVSGMLVCLESYFPSLASVVEAMRGVAGLNTRVYLGYWVFTSCCIWVSPLPMQVQHTYVSVLLLSWQPWERWFFWAALGEPQPQGLDTLLFISLPIGYLAPDHIFKVHLDIYRFHSALVYRHSY